MSLKWNALIAIWLPEATRLHESDAERTEQDLGRLMAQLVLVMALIWFGIVAVGGEVLRLLTDPRFHSASIYLPWIAGGVFFYGCYHLGNTGLFLNRKLKWSALLAAVVGAFSLLANMIFIPEYGASAAAIVRCLSFALLASAVFWVAQSKHHIPLPMGRLAAIWETAGARISAKSALSKPCRAMTWNGRPKNGLASTGKGSVSPRPLCIRATAV